MTIKEILQKTIFYNLYIYFKERDKRNRYLEQKYGNNKKAKTKAKLACLALCFNYRDFYRLKGEDKTLKELRDYLTYTESSGFNGSHTTKRASTILRDKWLSYNHFMEFYGRRVALIEKTDLSSGVLKEKLCSLMEKGHDKRLIYKPLSKNKGAGIQLFESCEEALKFSPRVRRWRCGTSDNTK